MIKLSSTLSSLTHKTKNTMKISNIPSTPNGQKLPTFSDVSTEAEEEPVALKSTPQRRRTPARKAPAGKKKSVAEVEPTDNNQDANTLQSELILKSPGR